MLAAGGLPVVVVRTSWVYAATGKNFVLTMLKPRRATRPNLRVVADQIGCPTATPDLARAILAIADTAGARPPTRSLPALYHAAGGGQTSWHGLAVAALEGGRPGHSRSSRSPPPTGPPRRGARPDSRLDCGKLDAGVRAAPAAVAEPSLAAVVGDALAA